MGNIHFFAGNFREAIDYWSYSAQYGNPSLEYYNIASAYALLGDIPLAYKYSLLAVDHGVDKKLLYSKEPEKIFKKNPLYKEVLAYAEEGLDQRRKRKLKVYKNIWILFGQSLPPFR